MYYELNEPDGLQSVLQAFEVWLRRNKVLSPYQQEVHLNLIRIVKKLQSLRELQEVRQTARRRDRAAVSRPKRGQEQART